MSKIHTPIRFFRYSLNLYLVSIDALPLTVNLQQHEGMWAGQQKKVRVVAVQNFNPIPQLVMFIVILPLRYICVILTIHVVA